MPSDDHSSSGPVPADLGGFQNITNGYVQKGDLLVFHVGVNRVRRWSLESEVGDRISEAGVVLNSGGTVYEAWVYRKIPVPHQGQDLDDLVFRTPAPSAKSDAVRRKGIPVYTGFIAYFPDAILAVAKLSRIGNDQHNPGKPLHWDRSKSGDELDALFRHGIDTTRGHADKDNVPHEVKVAWRAMANLQKYLEKNPKFILEG